ncbi:MAG: methylated-DNA--[protein]-cysteine S-methyltransferase [Bacteroidales bacterium]|nr:methylated-DNA--[protein]-cysteine S-methyltransferase [Bacteroidales bacterium]
MDNSQAAFYKSPIGTIEIKHSGKGISSLIFKEKEKTDSIIPENLLDSINQLDEYFSGSREVFELDLDLQGTEFQKKVWSKLFEIPFGKTYSYMDIAKKLGNTKTIRAVGKAIAKNPVSIIVPCHRVIGSDGKLTGYAGGIWRKKWMLEHERKISQLSLF